MNACIDINACIDMNACRNLEIWIWIYRPTQRRHGFIYADTYSHIPTHIYAHMEIHTDTTHTNTHTCTNPGIYNGNHININIHCAGPITNNEECS